MMPSTVTQSAAWAQFQARLKVMGTRSPETRYRYTNTVARFLAWLQDSTGLTPDQAIAKAKMDEDQVYRWLARHLEGLADQGKASGTMHFYLETAKKFFQSNEVYLNRDKLRQRVECPRVTPVAQDRIPTQKELAVAFQLCNGLLERAFLATAVSTGMRRGELCKFRVSDAYLKEAPYHVRLRAEYTKGRRPRIVLLTKQARDLLDMWIKQRNLHPHDIVFPLKGRRPWAALMRPFRKAGIGEKVGNFWTVKPHSLRKYTRTTMAASGVSEAFTNRIMGHRAYLDESYFRASLNQLVAEFAKAEQALTLGAIPTVEDQVQSGILRLAQEVGISRDQLLAKLQTLYHLDQLDLEERVSPAKGREEQLVELTALVFPDMVKTAILEIVDERKATILPRVLARSDQNTLSHSTSSGRQA